MVGLPVRAKGFIVLECIVKLMYRDHEVRQRTRSKLASFPSVGPNCLPTSTLNASGSGAARNRIAVFMWFVLAAPIWDDRSLDGAVLEVEEEGEA